MANSELLSLLCLLLAASSVLNCHGQERKVHVVYMGERPQGDFPLASTHHSMLKNVLGSPSLAKESLIHSYRRSFNGFVARLTDEEAAKFSEMEGVISVFPNRILKLHTTRSWDFMGFSKDNLSATQEGSVVIGLLDTGIWPESESFNDKGLTAPPAKWKGKCTGANFTCNNKIIGARYYNIENSYDITDFHSPRDSEGHGTHTSSIAAGRKVHQVSYYGLAEGIARGGVPNARIAMYKVCWSTGGCPTADILAAFDDAIADGVDILSVSIGFPGPVPYFEDPIAIGSFHAMKNGILTSNSAGNSGPFPFSVYSTAPWALSVAASSIDRKFVAQVVLGNGVSYPGFSINSFNLNGTSYPLIWGGDAANYSAGANPDIAKSCVAASLDSNKVEGKIVLCEDLFDTSDIVAVNGLGTIITDSTLRDFAFSYTLPATVLSAENGQEILNYIRSTEYPIATILFGETWDDAMAPKVVSFSSRGPNRIAPDILKPDITAPGVDILAAWSPVAPPSFQTDDTRSVNFNIISGTSMSCPHASATAAYVKAAHPNWSPSAIKSAIMTTAKVMDPRKQEDLEFAYGSGHINPAQAIDPGLVYDANEADYINFLCTQGYNTTLVQQITGENSTVCNSTKPGRAWDLNYPSFSLAVEDGQKIDGVFTRTVTNVGPPNSNYTVTISMPAFVSIDVEPQSLSFSTVGEQKSFTVTVTGPKIEQQPIVSGAIVWEDGVHQVRSPVVVYSILPGALPSSDSVTKNNKQFNDPSSYTKKGILGRN